MKNLALLSLLALILFSCKKDNGSTSTTPKGKKYKVSFKITNFAQQVGAFSVAHPGKLAVNDLVDPKDYLDVLYYVVYDSELGRTPVSFIAQDSTMANMGTIVDSLPNGTYPVRIFAGKKGLTTNAEQQYAVFATYGYGGVYWQDTFWTGFNINVQNGSVTQNVTLNRVVSKLELQVLDNIPANANTISISISPEISTQDVETGSLGSGNDYPDDTVLYNVTIPASAKGHPNFTVDRIISPSYLLTVNITCKDAGNNVIATATVNSVSTGANKKTILSGNLFGGTVTNSQAFQVKIDTAWNSTPIHAGF